MGKLSDFLKGFKEKIKSLSKTMKIAIVVAIILFVGAMIFLIINANNNKYGVLFSNLDPNDAKVVTEKLKEKKVENKVSGNTIYVAKESVDELRLELAPDLTNGSKGYELLDQGQSFGMTDEEFKIKKQRVLQGEIERTIKSFPEVENARVHLTLAEESVFVKDNKPGKASVFLKLKTGTKLSKEQVRSILALVSGATANTPKENIEVIDDKMNLLSKDLFDENGNETVSASSLEKQKGIETDFNSKLEKAVLDMLEPVIGKGKVKAKISSELDFDSKKKTQVVVDPNKVAVSEQTSKETSNQPTGQTSSSPVDNNMTNSTSNNTGNAQATKEEQKVNYEVGKTETTVISAPGEVKRISASVIVDGNLDTKTQDNIKSAVAAAIGFKQDRGDQISVLGMAFDQEQKQAIQNQLSEMEKEAQAAKQKALYTKIAIAGGIGLLAILAIILFAKKKRKNKNNKEDILGLEEVNTLDVLIEDGINPKDKMEFAPIDFDIENENSHLEKEIRKYANEKPEQVADIIKSWMADDERG